MGRLFYSADELLRRPVFPGMHDPTQLYFHFRPARPANLLVTRDPISDELNLSAGTYGLLSEKPYTICLHIAKHSYDSARNIQALGSPCVVALPGRDIVQETWFASLPIPRGIFEGDIGELTLLPSRVIDVPGIAECPVNLECCVEFVKDWHTHYVVFTKVVGASIDEKMAVSDRLDVIRCFPVYEVDDQTNEFGGAIERLGVNGELLACPFFPVGPRDGGRVGSSAWIDDLKEAGYLGTGAATTLSDWLKMWERLLQAGKTDESLRRRITRALELAAWEQWHDLHDHVTREHSCG